MTEYRKHEKSEENTISIVVRVLEQIGPIGWVTVLWTFIFCAAMYSQNKESLNQVWNYLYYTWIGIVVIWMTGNMLAGFSFFNRNESVFNTNCP